MKRFAKFFVVGVCAFAVDWAVLKLFVSHMHFDPYSARVVSFLCAASFSWVGNRSFTFRDRTHGHAGKEWMRFLAVSAGGFVLNYGTYALLITYVPFVREHLGLGVAAGAIAGMFFNFGMASKLVFPKA
jgi:putative flippase GtrA